MAATDRPSTAAEVDADGFQTVRGNAWRRRMAAAAAGAPTAREGQAHTQEGEPGRGGSARGADAGAAGDQEGGGAEAAEPPPSADDLHQEWLEEVAIVRKLRQQGLASDHPAMAAACHARDEAEARWRGAKDPAPPAVRLGRAQSKLDRAVSLQAETRAAIMELERAHKARLADLQAKLEEDAERVRLRRRQLAEVQDEVAGRGVGGKARAKQGQAVQKVHATLSGTIAPAISALVEQVDSASPAWTILNGLLGTLASSQSLLEEAIAPESAVQNFDIGDDAGGGDAKGSDGDFDASSDAEWSESHELHNGCGGQRFDDREGGGQGGTYNSAWGAAQDEDQHMGDGEWWAPSRAEWESGVRWQACGHGKWNRTRPNWADSWEDERARDDSGADQPAAARRRLDPTPTPQGTQGGPEGVGAGAGTVPTDDARRQQLHAERTQSIIAAAIEAGVQPLTSTGDDLRMLDADQLDAWAAENLPASGPRG